MSASTFYQLAGKQIKELVRPYGFKKNGKFFYRITEEGIIQQFCLLWLHNDFTIRFYLTIIFGYNGRDIEGAEIYEITNGSINQWLSDCRSGYQIDPEFPENNAANICVQAVKETLLPFFESHKDPLSAKDFVVKHNPRVTRGIDKYDIRELDFYLCTADIASVQDYLTYYIENHHRYNKNWWNTVEQEYYQLLDAICLNDREAIALYMDEKRKHLILNINGKENKTKRKLWFAASVLAFIGVDTCAPPEIRICRKGKINEKSPF